MNTVPNAPSMRKRSKPKACPPVLDPSASKSKNSCSKAENRRRPCPCSRRARECLRVDRGQHDHAVPSMLTWSPIMSVTGSSPSAMGKGAAVSTSGISLRSPSEPNGLGVASVPNASMARSAGTQPTPTSGLSSFKGSDRPRVTPTRSLVATKAYASLGMLVILTSGRGRWRSHGFCLCVEGYRSRDSWIDPRTGGCRLTI